MATSHERRTLEFPSRTVKPRFRAAGCPVWIGVGWRPLNLLAFVDTLAHSAADARD